MDDKLNPAAHAGGKEVVYKNDEAGFGTNVVVSNHEVDRFVAMAMDSDLSKSNSSSSSSGGSSSTTGRERDREREGVGVGRQHQSDVLVLAQARVPVPVYTPLFSSGLSTKSQVRAVGADRVRV